MKGRKQLDHSPFQSSGIVRDSCRVAGATFTQLKTTQHDPVGAAHNRHEAPVDTAAKVASVVFTRCLLLPDAGDAIPFLFE